MIQLRNHRRVDYVALLESKDDQCRHITVLDKIVNGSQVRRHLPANESLEISYDSSEGEYLIKLEVEYCLTRSIVLVILVRCRRGESKESIRDRLRQALEIRGKEYERAAKFVPR